MYPLAQIIDCTVMGKVDIDYIYDGNADIDSVFVNVYISMSFHVEMLMLDQCLINIYISM